MHIQKKWNSGVLVSLVFTLLLAACSSGGSDNSSPPAPATSAEGAWNGTTNTNRSVAGLVLSDGTYWFLYSMVGNPNVIAGLVQGNGSSQTGSFTSSNTRDFNFEGFGTLDATLAGSYAMKQSLSGTVTYVLGGQTTFNSTYNADYDLIPNVNLVVGTYTGSTVTAGGTGLDTVTLSSPNLIAGSDANGCDFTGSFAPRSSGNVYDVSVTPAGGVCGTETVNGVAFFDAGTRTLYIAALNSTRTNGFIFLGTKPASTAKGLWTGTMAGRTVKGAVLDDGTYWFLYSAVGTPTLMQGTLQGNGSTSNGTFASLNGLDFNNEFEEKFDVTVTGPYVMQQDLSGTVTYQGGGQLTFTSTFNSENSVTPIITNVAGIYSGSVFGFPHTMTVSPTGTITVTTPPNTGYTTGVSVDVSGIELGCDFTGTLTPRSQGGNMYDIVLTPSANAVFCPSGSSGIFTGVAFFDDTNNKRIYVLALNSSRNRVFPFTGTRP